MKATAKHLLLASVMAVVASSGLSGCASNKSYVVLMRNDDGKLGKVKVSARDGGSTLLDQQQQATVIGSKAGDTFLVADQQIASDFAVSLNPSYTVNNGLRVSAAEQNLLDDTLAKRIIEFESGKATLTDSGKGILDEMAAAMQKVKGKKVEVIGHTDNVGLRDSNLALSHARAQAVRGYLADRGISQDMVMVSGQGPDRPVAENSSADGRARNRRIEFRIAQ